MAIDDNANYTLTGAQVKDLANVVNGKADSGDIPTVNDATLTIQKNGTDVQTFTANQSTNATANITVPTGFSDLSGTVAATQFADNTIDSSRLDNTENWVCLGSHKTTSAVTNNQVLYVAIPSGWRSTSLKVEVMMELSANGWIDLRAYNTNGNIISNTVNIVYSVQGAGGGYGYEGVNYIVNIDSPGAFHCCQLTAESIRTSSTGNYRSWIGKAGCGYAIRVSSALAANANDIGSLRIYTSGTAQAGAYMKVWGRKDN